MPRGLSNPDRLPVRADDRAGARGGVRGFTFLNAAGDRAQHGFTGTLREHRGRGLATAAKRRALQTAAVRGVTRVTTSNAEENAAMRTINRNLGFEPIGEHVIFGRDL
jgi:RimJ/RimL family protein N-acetyltransferase